MSFQRRQRSRRIRENERIKRSVFLLFMVSYISILLISMAINILYYQNVEKKMLENVKRSSFAMLGQLQVDIDNKIREVNQFSNNIVFDKKVEMFLKGDHSPFSHRDIMEDLMVYPKYEYIYDYYLYCSQSDEIITATIKSGSEPFYSMMYNYSDMDYDVWKDNILSKYHFNKYLSTSQLNAYGLEERQVITFIQSIPVNNEKSILGQVVILIDESKINGAIDKMSWASEGHIYILDKQDTVITASREAPQLSNDLKSQLSIGTSVIDYRMGRDDAVVLCHTSPETQWKYIMVTPKSTFLAEINRIKIFAFILLISCLIIGLTLAYFFSRRNYKPIKEIKDMIPEGAGIGKSSYRNEFEYIKSSIVDIFENHSKLNSVINTQLPIMRSDYMLKLLRGYMGSIDIDDETLEFMGIKFISDEFVVILSEVDEASSFFATRSEKEWALARFVVGNVGAEIMEDYIHYFVEIQRERTAFILNIPSDAGDLDAESMVKSIISKFEKALFEICSLSMNFGISGIHRGVIELRECYDEAIKALDYAVLLAAENIIFFDQLVFKDNYYYYPIDTEVQLMNMLRAGDYVGAEDIIETLFEINFKSRDTSLEAGRYFVIDILTTHMKVMNTIQAKTDEAFLSMDSLMEIAQEYDRVEEIEKEVKEVAYGICDVVQQAYMSPGEQLICEVEKYIEKNYCEHWLSLSAIADNFSVTLQYLSSLFKKHRDENITDYIARLKIERAKELLVSTDLTIYEIGVQLGYANDAGISRLFKKYEGVTPGVYREQWR